MVATGSDDLSPEDLTRRLRASGALPTGRVIAVQSGERRNTLVSTIVSLRVEYSADTPPPVPTAKPSAEVACK